MTEEHNIRKTIESLMIKNGADYVRSVVDSCYLKVKESKDGTLRNKRVDIYV